MIVVGEVVGKLKGAVNFCCDPNFIVTLEPHCTVLIVYA